MGSKKKRSKQARNKQPALPTQGEPQTAGARIVPELNTASPEKCYEIRDAGSKGVGVFATRLIPAGTLITTEKPILTFFQNPISPEDVTKALASRSMTDKQRFANLRTAFDMPNRAKGPLPHASIKRSQEAMNYMRVNSNSIPDKDTSNVYDEMCRFNHSCKVNAHRYGVPSVDVGMQCRAVSDIQEGEEITVCYSVDLYCMTAAERKAAMPMMGYFWECECNICQGPPAQRLVSDMRRRLIRLVKILMLGRDISLGPGVNKLDVQAIRSAAFQKTAQWNEDVRNTIYLFLTATLLDAEGAAMDEVSTMYGQAALTLACHADKVGLARLPAPVLLNIMAWRKRAEELVALSPGSKNDMWVHLRKGLDSVASDGDLS
ncbi:hypothetical protein LTR56_013405 [Elasticomyces elasticus]|nr:hypothetical protein LTR22_025009 [Elasticomyces elasticus]KAK3637802.1 hypothetical protein LTR56_013405 [Elasticomyces elasticus]KAK4905191.1 hypothetical protein LTR49_025469 [Elasticomyces elasticus]KAK5742118.1 hypothetical protein LTS12_024362 [Elasticomyces elasticus]